MKKVFLVIIALDVIFFGGFIAQNEYKSRVGVEVLLPVRGYDPRDMLSGHYVRFRLLAEQQAKPFVGSGRGGRVMFCLEKDDAERWNVTGITDCALGIAGTVTQDRVDFPIDRFFVDESRANEVVSFGEAKDTYVRARVDSEGSVQLLDLVVNGKSFSGH